MERDDAISQNISLANNVDRIIKEQKLMLGFLSSNAEVIFDLVNSNYSKSSELLKNYYLESNFLESVLLLDKDGTIEYSVFKDEIGNSLAEKNYFKDISN